MEVNRDIVTRINLVGIFVVLLLGCAYVAWAMNWRWQRHEFLKQETVGRYAGGVAPVAAPIALWVVGEEGITSIGAPPELYDEAMRLFPEADVSIYGGHFVHQPDGSWLRVD